MSFIWTSENIRKLSPDGLTFDRARGIFFGNKWLSLGGNSDYIWAVYPAGPTWKFHTAVKLTTPSFFCSCRSRTKPCKHNLALLLQLQRNSDSFHITSDLPDWVLEWRKDKVAAPKKELSAEEIRKKEVQQKESRDRRLEQMKNGVQDLERWLESLLQQGLAEVKEYPLSFWDDFAARMVDNKLGGIARNIRLIKEYIHSENGHERLLGELADFYLLTRAFHNIDALPKTTQADMLNIAGFVTRKEEVLTGEATSDDWLVMGQNTGVEEKLSFRRTWLKGLNKEKYAVILEFVWGNQGFEHHWTIGHLLEGALCYYPSSFPMRALFQQSKIVQKEILLPSGYKDFESFATDYAKALAQNPWLSGFPALLESVYPIMDNGTFFLLDKNKKQLKFVENRLDLTLKLLALSCGQPISVFGEWNGFYFMPLSAFAEGRLEEIG